MLPNSLKSLNPCSKSIIKKQTFSEKVDYLHIRNAVPASNFHFVILHLAASIQGRHHQIFQGALLLPREHLTPSTHDKYPLVAKLSWRKAKRFFWEATEVVFPRKARHRQENRKLRVPQNNLR